MVWIIYNTETRVLLSISKNEPSINEGESKVEVDFVFNSGQPSYFYKYINGSVVENNEESIQESLRGMIYEYEIQDDVDDVVIQKDIRTINYKTELNTLVSYTPEYTIHEEGEFSGLLSQTCYYRDYVDENNKGVLVLCVDEDYVIDSSDTTLNNSGKPAIERTKTWKYAKKNGGGIDQIKTKKKKKHYNTRRKRHVEGIKRRENILEQLIDNVGIAGVLSGIFTSVSDAHDKMTLLLEVDAGEFEGWKASGRGTLYQKVLDDTTIPWLSDLVSNSSNQPEPQRTVVAPIEFTTVAHMMGMEMRAYISEKLKGNIK